MSDVPPQPSVAQPPRWQPLPSIDRRVLGVLVEKAKTTPDAYPMSLNALIAGCNQKSNRYPLMNVDEDQVEQSLEHLRALGAVAVIQGGGRVERFRHYMYEWLGVDKAEMAVMTELLLRGAQTEGELRGRAARMEPIADVAALRPVLDSLKAKKLLLSLTSEGRGHVVTHALYEPRELERLRTQFAAGNYAAASDANEEVAGNAPKPAAPPMRSPVASASPAASSSEIAQLKAEIADLRNEVDQLSARCRDCIEEVERLKFQLGG